MGKKDKGCALPFKSLKVLSTDFKVVRLPDLDADSGGSAGMCHQSARTPVIRIASHDCPFGELDTVMHELTHAIFYILGYKGDDDEREERLVGTLATGLVAAFRDNPMLVRWMVEKLAAEWDDSVLTER